MTQNDLPTIEYIVQLENRLNNRIDKIVFPINCDQPTYLRTKQVKKLLSVSDNKLRSMREKGEIPFSFLGNTYYYPESEILELLKNNTITKTN